MEIFTLVTGILYVILEIRQKSLMWLVGIVTSLAAMWVFFRQGLYASFGLNTYYLITAVIGLWQWGRDRRKLSFVEDRKAVSRTEDDVVHLNRLNKGIVLVSLLVLVAGTFALAEVMEAFENPMSWLDSFVAVLSAVATWWLVRSYLQQWMLWILANALSSVLCMSQGLWWMSALYLVYVLSSAIGYFHWRKCGVYVEP